MVKESSGVDQKSTMLQLVDLWRKSGILVRTLSDFRCMLKVPISIEHFTRTLKSTVVKRVDLFCFSVTWPTVKAHFVWCMEQMLNSQRI